MVPLGGAGIGMHVIPVEQAIPATQQSVSVEHISYWLKKYEINMQSEHVRAEDSRESAVRVPVRLRVSFVSV